MKIDIRLSLLVMVVLSINTHLHAEIFIPEDDYTSISCELRLKARPSIQLSEIQPQEDAYHHFTYPHLPFLEGTSLNWGGYAALTNLAHPAHNAVTAVSGSWIVPKLSSAPHNTYCSLWIGIDGYASNTVEQIGTAHDWINGRQQNYAWFEMYPNYAYEISGFPVNPGDSISASVIYRGNNIFVLTIVNNTRKLYFTIPTSYTTLAGAQRSSAEWVAEAPYMNGILPLSHFNTASFSNCTAIINGVTGAINNHTWAHDALTMVTTNAIAKAIPNQLSTNGQAFTVAWHHE